MATAKLTTKSSPVDADELSRQLSALRPNSSNSSFDRDNKSTSYETDDVSFSRHDETTPITASSSRPTTGMSSVTTQESANPDAVSSREGTDVSQRSADSHRTSLSVSRETSQFSSQEERAKSRELSFRDGCVSKTGNSEDNNYYDEDDFEDDDGNSDGDTDLASHRSSRTTSRISTSRQPSHASHRPDDDGDLSNSDTDIDNSDVDENRKDKLEKENSVLIEKDGKFELVDEKELTSDQRIALGLTDEKRGATNSSKKKQRKSTTHNKLKLPADQQQQRVHKTSNLEEFPNLRSEYAMSEQQKEMKTRRISVMQMLRHEEKEKIKQEEEQKQVAADKSFKQWLAQKKETQPAGDKKPTSSHRKKKKTITLVTPPSLSSTTTSSEQVLSPEGEAERQELLDRAFKQWLDEKQGQSKNERRMEEIRLAEEAQNYVVRDRKQCDKAFNEWLRKKKTERQGNPSQTTRKKSQHHTAFNPVSKTQGASSKGGSSTAMNVANKKKSLVPIYAPTKHDEEKKQRRPRSSVRAIDNEGGGIAKESGSKRRPKTSTIRITDNYGYRHPASIDDFINRSGKN